MRKSALTIFFIFALSAQETTDIDPSLIQNLTPEQILQLQNQSSNQFETVDSSNISDEEESLKDEI